MASSCVSTEDVMARSCVSTEDMEWGVEGCRRAAREGQWDAESPELRNGAKQGMVQVGTSAFSEGFGRQHGDVVRVSASV